MCKFCDKNLEDGLIVNDKGIDLGVLGKLHLDCTWFKNDDPEYPWIYETAVCTEEGKVCSSYGFTIKYCPFCGKDLRESE